MLNLQSLSLKLSGENNPELCALLRNTAYAVYEDPCFEGPQALRENLPKILRWSSLLEVKSPARFDILMSAFAEMADVDYMASEEVIEALFWFYDQA